jgi:DNA-directed RNA polymerase specialized sigma24 family protein
MGNFDNTVDNRWRPDLESSHRRVHDDERDDVIYSRELSFVPARRKAFEPHDAQTRALIRRMEELAKLPHGELVSEMLEKWSWMDKMSAPEEKQRFLEPLIESVRRDPRANEASVIFLMLVFEPVRRSVSKAFVAAQAGLSSQPRDMNWSNREEARMMRIIEREELFDVTREAALEAIFRYPAPPPKALFPWLRETIAHRALDKLAGDLPEGEAAGVMAAQAEAIQRALAGFEALDEPRMRDRRGLTEWRQQIRMRDVFDVVGEFFQHDPVREACRIAIGRLPRRQREVVNGYFFDDRSVPELAGIRDVSESTIYNHKAAAQNNLESDDVFFSALHSLQRVRDQARARHLAAAYPNGVLPDGRRLVVIQDAA